MRYMDTDIYQLYYSKAVNLVQYFKKRHKELPFLGFEENYKWDVLQKCKGKSNLEIAQILSKSPCNFLYMRCMITMADLIKTQAEALDVAIECLRDEKEQFAARFLNFKQRMDAICLQGQSHPSDERTAAAILTCINPQQYTFFMHDKVYVPYRKYLEAPLAKTENRYEHFLRLLRPLVDVVSQDTEIQQIFQTLSRDNESSNLLTAQTILWCMQNDWDKINKTPMFTWIPFYEEVATKLLQYKDNRKGLLDWAYKELQGYTNALHDGNKQFSDIDPFTILGLFNRSQSRNSRETVISRFKDFFMVSAELPKDYDGIPVLNAQNSNFIANTGDPKYKSGCEDAIWNLLDAVVNSKPDIEKWFNIVSELPYVRFKMSMALFWVRPYDYLALDKNNRNRLAELGIVVGNKMPHYKEYCAILDQLRSLMRSGKVKEQDFPSFSNSAWDSIEEDDFDPYGRIMQVWKQKKNIILQGAPGTGKTYAVPECVVRLCNGLDEGVYDRDSIMEEYKQLVKDHRVAFTTFHQSMDYESFIEGIKANVNEEDTSVVTYNVEPGIFKTLCEDARNASLMNANKLGLNDNPSIWKVSLQGTGDNPTRKECLANNHIRIGWDVYGEVISEDTDFTAKGKSVLDAFYNKMQIGDIVLSCYSSRTIDAIGVVTSEAYFDSKFEEYKRVRDVKWLVKFDKSHTVNIQKMNGGKVMTLGTVYRLNAISLEEVMSILTDNKVKISSRREPEEIPYVLVIDEINRGNVSKIFGELITLLEADKRSGEENEISVKLPYSTTPFSVPSNVYIIGTMNTADRSVGYIDYAIRRRFAFETVKANSNGQIATHYSEIANEELGVTAQELFDAIQQFVEEHISPDFDAEDLMIGHSYFMAEDETALELKIEYEIRPLLIEYMRDGILLNVTKQMIDELLNIE